MSLVGSPNGCGSGEGIVLDYGVRGIQTIDCDFAWEAKILM